MGIHLKILKSEFDKTNRQSKRSTISTKKNGSIEIMRKIEIVLIDRNMIAIARTMKKIKDPNRNVFIRNASLNFWKNWPKNPRRDHELKIRKQNFSKIVLQNNFLVHANIATNRTEMLIVSKKIRKKIQKKCFEIQPQISMTKTRSWTMKTKKHTKPFKRRWTDFIPSNPRKKNRKTINKIFVFRWKTYNIIIKLREWERKRKKKRYKRCIFNKCGFISEKTEKYHHKTCFKNWTINRIQKVEI